ncbi:MAG: hypothetical protein M3Y21_09705 [Candidatus Eremiobacteraeota bacterium]|nr:hypothetical protein [Candidatus Eremiobacteraeota bacterium]
MNHTLTAVNELLRLPSPAPYPQALAHDGTNLWMGSRETQRIYGINPTRFTVFEELPAPGTPWGMTVTGNALRVVCGEPPDDNRFIRRYVMGHGFESNHRIPCPDDTGSYIAYGGDRLFLTQWYKQQILSLDDAGSVDRTVHVPHGICGIVCADEHCYLLTTDDEESNDYWITRIDLHSDDPKSEDLARVGFAARSLAWDGERFWTNHRDKHEIVAFAL